MVTIRRSDDRGKGEHGWLSARHSFSFAGYYDPAHMGFGDLLVINEDRVAPGAGFPTHPHRDMEIITYILDGELAHRDSLGSGSSIRPGVIQRMSAGTGIRHSEFNASKADPVHLLQIWIKPAATGMPASYEEKALPAATGTQLDLIAVPGGGPHAVDVGQDVRVYRALVMTGEAVDVPLAPGRRAWVQVASGSGRINGAEVVAGDGAAVDGETVVRIEASEPVEALVFDLR